MKPLHKIFAVCSFILLSTVSNLSYACISSCISMSYEHKPTSISTQSKLLTSLKNTKKNSNSDLIIKKNILAEPVYQEIIKSIFNKSDFKHITAKKPATTTISETDTHYLIKTVFQANNSDYFMVYDRIFKIAVEKTTGDFLFFKHESLNNNLHLRVYAAKEHTPSLKTFASNFTLDKRPVCKIDTGKKPKKVRYKKTKCS